MSTLAANDFDAIAKALKEIEAEKKLAAEVDEIVQREMEQKVVSPYTLPSQVVVNCPVCADIGWTWTPQSYVMCGGCGNPHNKAKPFYAIKPGCGGCFGAGWNTAPDGTVFECTRCRNPHKRTPPCPAPGKRIVVAPPVPTTSVPAALCPTCNSDGWIGGGPSLNQGVMVCPTCHNTYGKPLPSWWLNGQPAPPIKGPHGLVCGNCHGYTVVLDAGNAIPCPFCNPNGTALASRANPTPLAPAQCSTCSGKQWLRTPTGTMPCPICAAP